MEEQKEFKLTLCQSHEEWERFNNKSQPNYNLKCQVYIVTPSGYTDYKLESEETKPIEIDI